MKPYHQGRKAFRKPKFTTVNSIKALERNPYREGTKDHKDWQFGWNKAFYEHLELVKKREASTK